MSKYHLLHYRQCYQTLFMLLGNHFGFYEGGLVSAFSPLSSSYTYPPRVAAAFFNTIENGVVGQ